MLQALPFAQYPYLTGAVAAASAGLLVFGWIAWRRYNTPAEKERRRRSLVNAQGRLTDGIVTDFDVMEAEVSKGLIHYTYRIGGVEYSAAQDITDLLEAVQADTANIIGSVNVKYHSRNPFNSIVVCEGWSGLRRAQRSQESV